MTEVRSCQICKGDSPQPYRVLGEIQIVRCPNCGFLYRPSLPPDLLLFYDKDYYRNKEEHEPQWAGTGDYVADRERLLRSFDEHIADLEEIRPPGRLLDVGCATGFLLEAARRRGWEVVGLDISPYALEYARKEFDLDVRLGSIEDAHFPRNHFDAITAFEYIEHVPDPVSSLASMRSWLRSDGVLVMTTPNAGSWEARRHPQRFAGFLENRHLCYFTPSTLRRILRQTGLVPIEIRSDLTLVTVDTLASKGITQPQRYRSLVNRFAPGLKKDIRRIFGKLLGGPSFKVYARPSHEVTP